MSKKFATWYTSERWQKPTDEQARTYEDFFGRKPYKLICKSEDGTLFSKAHYPTKILPDELPSSFIHARIGKLFGYYDASRVVGVAYRPNKWINHLFRDDSLYLSFSESNLAPDDWDHIDIILGGWDIVSGLAALEYLSAIPKSKLERLQEALVDKVKTYQKTHPEEHDCISESEFWETLKKGRHALKDKLEAGDHNASTSGND